MSINPAAHIGLVHAFLKKIGARDRCRKARFDYDDLVQECLLEICKSAAKNPTFSCDESTYVWAIVERTAWNVLVCEDKRSRTEIQSSSPWDVEDADEDRRREVAEEVEDLLTKLDARALDVVLSYYGIGRKEEAVPAIAARLGLSVRRVHELLAHARAVLRA